MVPMHCPHSHLLGEKSPHQLGQTLPEGLTEQVAVKDAGCHQWQCCNLNDSAFCCTAGTQTSGQNPFSDDKLPKQVCIITSQQKREE